MEQQESDPAGTDWHDQLRRLAYWLALVGSALFMATSLIFTFYFVWFEQDVRQVLINHFAATVGLPSAALASLAIVTILQGTSGPIKISALAYLSGCRRSNYFLDALLFRNSCLNQAALVKRAAQPFAAPDLVRLASSAYVAAELKR